MNQTIKTVIFDLGGVLVDWNPEYLYTKIFKNDKTKMDWFLKHVCTPAWNMEQDAGRTLEEATRIAQEEHPEYASEISAFYDRWEEMIAGDIPDTVLILKELKRLNKVSLYALTNWSAETFPIAQRRFDFLNLFEGIVVSGTEKTRKPFTKIYEIILDRYQLTAEECLFIDDSLDNVETAKSLGINALHYIDSKTLREEMNSLGIL